MDSLRDIFLSEIEAFLSATGMDKTTFGKRATKDGGLVNDLRTTNRAPSTRTIERARAFMRRYAAEKIEEAKRVEEIVGPAAGEAA